MVRAAHAEAPLITVRHVGRRGGLTLLSGALLASAAMSCLPTTSSSPVPAPDDDDRRADDPPLTPDRTTGPTDLCPYETDDGQHDQDDDQSDGADDPAPPVMPPYLPIPSEAWSDMALESGLPGTANHLYGAFEEDLWYGVDSLGLADDEALERALYNQRAILRGDPSLRPHMELANDALAGWLHDFGQGWIVRRCYQDQKAWLLFLHAGEDVAERRALEKSQRLAEGQLFRANDPRNNATTPRPPGTHWDDLPPTTEGMEHFATIFHIPPPGADGPAALDPEGLPTNTLNPPHGTVTMARTISPTRPRPRQTPATMPQQLRSEARPHRRPAPNARAPQPRTMSLTRSNTPAPTWATPLPRSTRPSSR